MAAEEMAVTVVGAGDKSGTNGAGAADWDNAMDMAAFIADVEGAAEAGDIYWVESGEYIMNEDVAAGNDGVANSPITIIGVKDKNEPPTFADWAVASGDRPLFTMAGFAFSVDNYWIVYNIRATGTDTWVLRGDTNTFFYNCKGDNSGVATRYGIQVNDSNGGCINCEAISDNGYAFSVQGARKSVIFCYGHDSHTAFHTTYDETKFLFNIADTCTNGINIVDEFNQLIMNNTIYNCSNAGITNDTITSFGNFIINNIINDCGKSFIWNAATEHNFWAYNNIEGCGAPDFPPVGFGMDHWATSVDPEFTTPGSNFSLQDTSDCIDAGMSMELGV